MLEIGGGIGQVLLELLKADASTGEVVELVPSYEEHVRALATEAGLVDRASFRTADLVADVEARREADIVVLNKVVCCTPDGPELAGIAAALTRRTLVLSFPRDDWWARAAFGTINGFLRLRRGSFRVFVHSTASLRGPAEAHGLTLVSERTGPLFRIAAFERA